MSSHQYLRVATSVQAIRFDGTAESALAIAALFPGRIARALGCDDDIVAIIEGRLRAVPEGWWIILRLGHENLEVMRDEHFAILHRPSA